MINSKYIRDHLQELKDSLIKRKSDYPLDEIMAFDQKSREYKTKIQNLQKQKNQISKEIAEIKKQGKPGDSNLIEKSMQIKQDIDKIESDLKSYESKINSLIWNLPNILHESVPYGKSSDDNIEIKKWIPKHKTLDDLKPSMSGKTHEDILIDLNLLDLQNAAKVAGSRFYYLKNDLVILEQSLIRFALDELRKKGYGLIMPPYFLRKEYYRGATALGDFEEVLYSVADPKETLSNPNLEKIEDELFLISTSEHAIAAMHSDHVFSGNNLPVKYAGISTCFRREAGSHGKDTKGIFRVKQFNKVEQFVFSRKQDSWKHFNELLETTESIYQKLEIPYRAVDICTGDIGTVAAKKIDLEAYMPLQDKFREIISCSNCTDWQSIRLNIKYDENNERNYVHTLNSTGIATTRTIVAIVENNLNSDGSISIPDVLVPYFGKSKISKN